MAASVSVHMETREKSRGKARDAALVKPKGETQREKDA